MAVTPAGFHGQHGEGGLRLVASEVAAQGVEVTVFPITDIGLKELAEADIVFIGTWVDGLVLFGQRLGRAGRIKAMPVIDGKRVAAFMTYAINAGKALDRFARVLDERGATVVSRTCTGDRLEVGVAEFVTASLDSVLMQGLRPGARQLRLHDWGSLRAFLDPPNHPLDAGPCPRAGVGGVPTSAAATTAGRPSPPSTRPRRRCSTTSK